MRDGLDRCFERASHVVTQLRCYADVDYRQNIDCPFFLNFEDRGTEFSLSANLGDDTLQYEGVQFSLQLVTSTRLG